MLYIVILQYNNPDDTIELLESIKDRGFFNIVVVDNNSNKENLQKIKNYIKDGNLKLIVSENNLGYAGGNNVGIKYALNKGADYILILNNDTLIKEDDFFEKLIKLAQSDETTCSEDNQTTCSECDRTIGIMGPLIKEPGKTVYGGKIRWLRSKLEHIYKQVNSELQYQSSQTRRYGARQLTVNSFYVPGSCMLIKREVIEKIGLLPEDYFLYFEDAAYCLKAQKAGYKCIVTPEIKIYHKVSKSTSKLGNPLLLRYHFRNALYFNKNLGPWWAKILVYPWSSYIIKKQITKLIIGRNREISKQILLGVMDFYKGKMGRIES